MLMGCFNLILLLFYVWLISSLLRLTGWFADGSYAPFWLSFVVLIIVAFVIGLIAKWNKKYADEAEQIRLKQIDSEINNEYDRAIRGVKPFCKSGKIEEDDSDDDGENLNDPDFEMPLITKRYYKDCEKLAGEIYQHILDDNSNAKITSYVNEIDGFEIFDEFEIFQNVNPRLMVIELKEYIHVYSVYSPDFDLENADMLCLMLLVCFSIGGYDPEYGLEISYTAIMERYRQIFSQAANVIDTLSSMTFQNEEGETISGILDDIYMASGNYPRLNTHLSLISKFQQIIDDAQ